MRLKNPASLHPPFLPTAKKLTIYLLITTVSRHQTPVNKTALVDAAESGVSTNQKICMNKKKDSNEPAEQKKYNEERGSE